MSMLLTLELVVFAFGGTVTIVTALVKLLNRISELHTLMELNRADLGRILQEQAEQAREIQDVKSELRATRPAYGPREPH